MKTKPRVQNNAKQRKPKQKPRGKPFQPGNTIGFQKGQSGNPGGRPKLVSDAYREWLGETDPETGLTNAQALARAAGKQALKGDVSAAREIRSATEGERIRTWRDEIIDALRDDLITPEQVTHALGDELAGEIFIAAGLRRNANGETAGGRASPAPGAAAQ